MKIGIDATVLNRPDYTGISRSVDEVLKIWATLDTKHEFFLISNQEIYIDFEMPPNWQKVIKQWCIPSTRFWWWFEREKIIRENKIDVFWGTSYSVPRRVKNAKYCTTIYDLALFVFDNIGDPKGEKNTRKQTRRACRRSDKIIAISKSTKKDIEKILDVGSEKIAVSYCGGLPSGYEVIQSYKPNNENLRFNEEFLLYISTIEPRKNIKTIVYAFDEYKRRTNSKIKLVIAGKKGWRCEDIYEAIEKSSYSADIILPGYISENDKNYLLSNAKCFLFPSLYEGFGLPILEAYAYGLPVITTNTSSMPEVAGDVGFYVDNPFDYKKISENIETIVNLNEEELLEIKRRIKKQLQGFSWERNAKEILEILEKLHG